MSHIKGLLLNRSKVATEKAFFEVFIHEELKSRGHSLYLMPTSIVYHNKNYETKEALIECYHHGRSFGGMRAVNSSLSKRIAFILGSLILPILLPLRIALRAIGKRRHIKELSLSLPYLLLLMTCWSFGEFCGYMWGEGNSTARWK
jgi:hypothetical protein